MRGRLQAVLAVIAYTAFVLGSLCFVRAILVMVGS